MKSYRKQHISQKHIIKLISCLGIGVIIVYGMLVGCGKLSNDTSRPTNPIGTTGGVPIPVQPRSSIGTHTLSLQASSNTLVADNVNFITLTTTLEDSSGRTVAGFPVTFTTDAIGTLGLNRASTVAETTDQSGAATVRFYGIASGVCTVKATVAVAGGSLTVTTAITLTPGGPPSSGGTYTLELRATPNTIPADSATYAVISAYLRDSAGGSVENFTITFNSELGYLHNQPEPPTTWSTTATAMTDKNGGCSLYFYPARKGSAVVSASVTVPDLQGTLQAKVSLTITAGPGEPGPDVPGIAASVTPTNQVVQADETGVGAPEPLTVVADVWDSTGDRVGAGVRVEWNATMNGSPFMIGYASTGSDGRATFSIGIPKLAPGTYLVEITACTYGIADGVKYCDKTSASITVLVPEPVTLTIEPKAVPAEIEVGKTSDIIAVVKNGGLVVSNASVSFTATLGTVSPTTTTTSSFGIATATFQAGNTPGKATIYITATATLPTGGQASGNITLEVSIIAVPSKITPYIYPAIFDFIVGGTTGILNVKAIVEDSVGNRISGLTVTFTILSTTNCGGVTFSPPTSVTATTNAAGVAEPTITVMGSAVTTAPHCSYQMEITAGAIKVFGTGTVEIR